MAEVLAVKTVGGLNAYLRSLYPITRRSVDEVVAGDPQMEIKKIGTCWLPYQETLEQAYRDGVNVMVVHEPTFYSDEIAEYPRIYERKDADGNPTAGCLAYRAEAEKKREWIEQHQMAVIRCHDVLDIIGGFGIPYSLGEALGYSDADIVKREDYYIVYKIPRTTAAAVARQIAANLAAFELPGVAFYGDKGRMVESVGVGTGCICNPVDFFHMGAEITIAVDDSVSTWGETVFSKDTGLPLVIINHNTAEEMGVQSLNRYIKETLPFVCVHYPQGCTYEWITAGQLSPSRTALPAVNTL